MKRLFDDLDQWKIIQNKIEIENNRLAESIMSIGNNYMGMRGNYEEKYSGDSHRGSYIAGIWYPDKTRVGWWKNGYPEYFGKVPNSINYIGIRVFIDGSELDLFKCDVKEFKRELDMKNGVLYRKALASLDGKEIQINVARFLSIEKKELAVIKYEVKALNFNGEITFIPYLNSKVKNEDSNYEEEFWMPKASDATKYGGYVMAQTKENNFGIERFTVAAMMNLVVNGEQVNSTSSSEDMYSENKIVLKVEKNKSISIEKYVAVTTTRDYNEDELLMQCENVLRSEVEKGYEIILNQHCSKWNDRWAMADVRIDGDVEAQQGIRYNLFQLFSTYYGEDSRLNIGPKGFTGEKYGGATYWDTEAYCLPVYLGVASKYVARSLLEYRHNQLEEAKKNAKKLGLRGALFPMVTFTGAECHNEWEITFEEIHRNGSIIYAIYNYTNYTGDYKYIEEKGIDVIVEVARFWESRVHLSKSKSKYMIHGVTGSNEYENNINNNWYTNYLAKWCLEYAVENIEKLKTVNMQSITRNNITLEEVNTWADIAKNIYLPYDKELDIIVQHDNFLDKEFIEVKDLDKKDLPLNQNWSWDRILRSCFIKQADVLQGIYYFGDRFSKEEKRRNFYFYEKYTVHESSLSPCVYSIIAAEIDNIEGAYELYKRTARLDLDNYNNDTDDGLHITSMSGAWLSIVQGFAGMRTFGGILSFSPKLPKSWRGYSFNINYRGCILKITVKEESINIINIAKKEITLKLYDKIYTVKEELEITSEFITN